MPFDHEKAIAAWRRPFEHDRAFSAEDVEELESGLRDRIDALVAAGASQEAAFAEAMRRMGAYGTAEAEYRKVYWGKVRRGHRLRSELTWRLSMLKNYLKTAIRNLRRKPSYSFINVLGLAVGVACCLALLLYVRDELAYDRHHEDAASVYRVNMVIEQLGGEVALTPTIVAPLLLREFSEVQAATRMEAHGGVIRVGDVVFDDDRFYYADSTFFDVFTHPFLRGDPATALTRPNTVVLTASTAQKYFADQNPVGQTLVRNNAQTFEVTGVLADLPAQSHYQFDFLASFATQTHRATNETWGSANYYTFLRLHPGTKAQALQAKIDAHLAALKAADEDYRDLQLQPLLGIRLHSGVAYELDRTGDWATVYALSTIALLILLIACINYMNLATARSAQRAKEVGVRKALGAYRQQLVGQFYSESALLAAGGLLLALGFVALGLRGFSTLSGKDLEVGALLAPEVWGLVMGIFILVSLVAGSYPALYLSRFEPVRVLRGQLRRGRGLARLRRGLVVVQFSISAVLLIGTLVVMDQLAYMSEQHLGFDKEHLVSLPINDPVLAEQYPAVKSALQQHPGVVATTAVNQLPGWLGWASDLHAEGRTPNEVFLAKGLPSDAGIVGGLGLELVAGRAFPVEPPEPDSGAYQYLLNETALARLGWVPDDAVGRRVSMDPSRAGTVVGVVEDFHFRSFREAIEPLAIWYEPTEVNHLIIRLAPGDPRAAMDHLEAVWTQFAPHRPFSYRFLDDVYDQLYRNEQRLGQVVALFAGLALFVACLGLFGLASFTAEQRTREIGVRKVLGASVPSLVGLLSRDFLALVGVALMLSVPLAWLGLGRWLDTFAYRIELGLGLFLIAAALALAVALMAVSYQAIRAALADPVRSLRYE